MLKPQDMRCIRTGQLADQLGVHPQTLRRWEAEGRIPKAPRNPITGMRYWAPEDVRDVRRALEQREARPCPASRANELGTEGGPNGSES